MTHARQPASRTLWTPATYRIRVQGGLDASWSERLGGLETSPQRLGAQHFVTGVGPTAASPAARGQKAAFFFLSTLGLAPQGRSLEGL
jgi:hypothetical protein